MRAALRHMPIRCARRRPKRTLRSAKANPSVAPRSPRRVPATVFEMPAKALARIRRTALAEPDMRSRQRLMQPDACGIRMAATSMAPDARRVRHIGCAANSSHERQGGRAFAIRLKFDDQSVAADASTGCLSNAAIANAATWIRANRASPDRRSSNARLPDRAGHARQIVAVRGLSNFGARTVRPPARTRARVPRIPVRRRSARDPRIGETARAPHAAPRAR